MDRDLAAAGAGYGDTCQSLPGMTRACSRHVPAADSGSRHGWLRVEVMGSTLTNW